MIYVGKRRTSVARAHIKEGKGNIFINSEPIENYQPKTYKEFILEPITLSAQILKDKLSKIDIFVNVYGGGKISQAGAIRTAIGKALVDHFKSEELKKLLSNYDKHLLVSDVRQREPRKPWGHGKPRGKKQKSYR